MDELEHRLRAAMLAAAEPSPPGLMEAIRRRHRRHRRRVGTGCVLAVAALALAVPSVTHALRGAPAAAGRASVAPAIAGRASVMPRYTVPTPTVAAAPGTVLSGCGSANPGDSGSHWRTGAVEAGPSGSSAAATAAAGSSCML